MQVGRPHAGQGKDTLWGLAETATEREVRDLYLDVKDKLVAQRRVLEEHFRADYLTEFDRRVRRDGKTHDEFSQYDLASLELGLVDDDDLEETLKVNDMAAKLRRYCEEELAALDQRIGVLVGDATCRARPIRSARRPSATPSSRPAATSSRT